MGHFDLRYQKSSATGYPHTEPLSAAIDLVAKGVKDQGGGHLGSITAAHHVDDKPRDSFSACSSQRNEQRIDELERTKHDSGSTTAALESAESYEA